MNEFWKYEGEKRNIRLSIVSEQMIETIKIMLIIQMASDVDKNEARDILFNETYRLVSTYLYSVVTTGWVRRFAL